MRVSQRSRQRYHGKSWYVDNSVGSSGNGTSWATAWKNLANIVWASIGAGDTIYISGGSTTQTYSELLTIAASGAAYRPITLTRGRDAGHNGAVIINGANTRVGILLDTFNYVIIDALTVTNGMDTCIQIKNALGVIVQNCTFTSGDPANSSLNCRSIDVRNSIGGTGCVIIRYNKCATAASTISQADGIYSQGNNGVIYEFNQVLVSNNDQTAHSDCFQSYQDYTVYLRNNWLEQNGTNAAQTDNHGIWASDGQTGGVLYVTNNVIKVPVLTGGPAVTHWKEADATWTGTGIMNAQNNTIIGGNRGLNFDGNGAEVAKYNIVQPASGGYGVVTANATYVGANIDYNDINASGSLIANISGSAKTWANYQTAGFDANGVNIDPAFANAASNNYTPTAGSAVGKGATLQKSDTGPR